MIVGPDLDLLDPSGGARGLGGAVPHRLRVVVPDRGPTVEPALGEDVLVGLSHSHDVVLGQLDAAGVRPGVAVEAPRADDLDPTDRPV